MPNVNQTASVAQLIATSLEDHWVIVKEAVEIVDKVLKDGEADSYERSAVRQFYELTASFNKDSPYYPPYFRFTLYPPDKNYFVNLEEAQHVWAILKGIPGPDCE